MLGKPGSPGGCGAGLLVFGESTLGIAKPRHREAVVGDNGGCCCCWEALLGVNTFIHCNMAEKQCHLPMLVGKLRHGGRHAKPAWRWAMGQGGHQNEE